MRPELKELLGLEVRREKIMLAKYVKSDNGRQSSVEQKVTVRSLDMSNAEVKRRTGFCDKGEMYAYICVICNGDMDKIAETVTSLTWIKEWLLYLEMILLKVHKQQEDFKGEYKSRKILKVFDHKLTLVLAC